MGLKRIFVYFLICFFACDSLFFKENVPVEKIKKIVIDAGHGGPDTGTRNAQRNEKDIVLTLSKILEKQLKKNAPDLQLFFTRKTDTLISLQDRAQLANDWKADLFISLHVNHSPKPHIEGIETYIVSTERLGTTIDIATRENASLYLEENHEEKYKNFLHKNPEFYIEQHILQKDFAKKSLELADHLQQQLILKTGAQDRSVKQAGFVVLFLTRMPSVLIEIGFLSNQEEEKKLSDVKYLEKIAQGIVTGLLNYIKEKNASAALFSAVKAKENEIYTIQIGRSKNDLVLIPQNFKGLNPIFKKEKNTDFIYFYGKFKLKEDAQNQLKIIQEKFPDAFILHWYD